MAQCTHDLVLKIETVGFIISLFSMQELFDAIVIEFVEIVLLCCINRMNRSILDQSRR